jgi:hypothetical protein
VLAARTESAQSSERYSGGVDQQFNVKLGGGSTDRLTRYERRAIKQLEAALEILQLMLRAGL